MTSFEDFRTQSRSLLVELDAATIAMMTLVTSKCVAGPEWEAAAKRQHDAYERWNAFLNIPG